MRMKVNALPVRGGFLAKTLFVWALLLGLILTPVETLAQDSDSDGVSDALEGFGTLLDGTQISNIVGTGTLTDGAAWDSVLAALPSSQFFSESFEGAAIDSPLNGFRNSRFSITATHSSALPRDLDIDNAEYGTSPRTGSRQATVQIGGSPSETAIVSINFNQPVVGFGLYLGDIHDGGAISNLQISFDGTPVWDSTDWVGSNLVGTVTDSNTGASVTLGNQVFGFIGNYDLSNPVSNVTITYNGAGTGDNFTFDDISVIFPGAVWDQNGFLDHDEPNQFIAVTKAVDTSALSSPPQAGEIVTYTYTTRNLSNVTMFDIDVIEDGSSFTGTGTPPVPAFVRGGGNVDGDGDEADLVGRTEPTDPFTLAQTTVHRATYAITEADIVAGFVDNQASANAVDAEGSPQSDLSDESAFGEGAGADDPTRFTLTPAPQLGVAKSASVGALLADRTANVTYTIVVQNTGNLTLDTLSLVDDLTASDQLGSTFNGVTSAPVVSAVTIGAGSSLPTSNGASYDGTNDLLVGSDGVLAPGDSYQVEFTVNVDPTAAGAPASLNNMATASGDDLGGTTVSDASDNGTNPTSNPGGPGTPTPIVLPIPVIDAVDDAPTAVNGASGATTASVLDNDTLNGSVLDPADISLGTSGTANDGVTVLGLDVTPTAGSITMNAAGEIEVAAGTTAGTYVFTYEICETLNSTNCDTAQATVSVDAAAIDAVDDAPTAVNGASGATTASVLDNDTLNGIALNPAEVTLTNTGTARDGVTVLGLDVAPATGSITMNAAGEIEVAPGTTAGTYVFTYEICETLNPTNCDTARMSVEVSNPSLIDEIAEDLIAILEEDRDTTVELQSQQARDFAAGALDRLRQRGARQCATAVNDHLNDRPILFDTDKAIIKPESDPILDEIAEILGSCEGSAFEIAGHTDSDASDAYNLALSQRRVDAVLQALTARGVDTVGYRARGYGESRPIDTNATAQGKASNRRVEFTPIEAQEQYDTCKNTSDLDRTFNLQANGSDVAVDGGLFHQNYNCARDVWETIEGSLNFLETDSGLSQTLLKLSYRRERFVSDDRVRGYFVGIYGSTGDVTSRAEARFRALASMPVSSVRTGSAMVCISTIIWAVPSGVMISIWISKEALAPSRRPAITGILPVSRAWPCRVRSTARPIVSSRARVSTMRIRRRSMWMWLHGSRASLNRVWWNWPR